MMRTDDWRHGAPAHGLHDARIRRPENRERENKTVRRGEKLAWMNSAALALVGGLICGVVALIVGDAVKLPGRAEIRVRREVRVVLGLVGVGLFVWGGVQLLG